MTLSAKDLQHLRQLVKQRVECYPDLEGMVAAGKLSYRAGWYQADTKDAYDAIIQYATSVRVSKDGKAQIKVAKPSKRLAGIAAKL
ncbi:hypothetical protein [Cupriavidus sp. UYPR2.512]|uniref:hypothetical protein n=1 Tax=Cupriavidus sp. UYPR2.512 TaxID=1080187 RepID=UPI0003779170|nr:hypothetical protein [Cupriavidus sp. UYPR2.512]UIF88563.1 hypothetical protein KAF44_24905 [Cupriavidus necator]UIF89341.1 hypothetical protein KAF44_28930 [Cupriavidus necator]